MAHDGAFHVSIPRFDEAVYLAAHEDARHAVASGIAADGFDHFLRHGIDAGREPSLRRDPAPLAGTIERCFVSASGYFLILGWLADEGCGALRCRLFGSDFTMEVAAEALIRHARADVEREMREGAYDFGFLIFGKSPSRTLLKQPVLVQLSADGGSFQGRTVPEMVADKRLLDTLLIRVAHDQAHAGHEAALHAFLAGAAGAAAVSLFRGHVETCAAGHSVERFRPRPVERSFVTVLFGSAEAMLVQPVLFRQNGIDFGEWIYVCNSPEDANTVLRLGRLMSDLYDVAITVVILPDNVGFGAANNIAVSHAAGRSIYLLNPDVYPVPGHADVLSATLANRELGSSLWGGLLFYDDDNLMHSGMFLEEDCFFRSGSLNRPHGRSATSPVRLLRVEHFDKGVPFETSRWRRPKIVPAITGAVMAFRRPCFEKLGGFSTRYIYGHYEDADLSLRWADENGPVVIDPDLRLVHLEGQGSRARGDQYRGAAIVNRHLFSAQHGAAFARDAAALSDTRELDPSPR